jgi:hypothetical protein
MNGTWGPQTVRFATWRHCTTVLRNLRNAGLDRIATQPTYSACWLQHTKLRYLHYMRHRPWACCLHTRCIVTWPLSHKLCTNLYFHHLDWAPFLNIHGRHSLQSWYYGCPLYRVPQHCIGYGIFIEQKDWVRRQCAVCVSPAVHKQVSRCQMFCTGSSWRGEDTIKWTPAVHWHCRDTKLRPCTACCVATDETNTLTVQQNCKWCSQWWNTQARTRRSLLLKMSHGFTVTAQM